MSYPIQVTFHGLEPSPAIEARVRERAEKLAEFYDRIVSCRVVVEAPHHHHHKGRLYTVRIDLSVPGDEIVVNRNSDRDHSHEDVYVAIRDAFDAARRRLQDYVRRRRGFVKRHEPPAVARVARLFPEEGYGFLVTPEGDEIYFHRNAVLNDGFARLKVGCEVRYSLIEGEGIKGPQASTVHLVGKPREGG